MTVEIPAAGKKLQGSLVAPGNARGLVIFVHGSGSSRFSPRNSFVARRLQTAGLATLLFDLLTGEEDENHSNRFDIPLITSRLIDVISWVGNHRATSRLPIGLFGASTGSAAALRACAAVAGGDDSGIATVVSRGGRPDLVMQDLPAVRRPTLLIVGGADEQVLMLNRKAFAALACEKRLEVVPGAGHLFEEKGALERVADLSAAWFSRYLNG